MKASILQLTILGLIAINVVTGGPIEDPKQEASSENINRNGNISHIDVHSRRKRSNGDCTTITVGSSETQTTTIAAYSEHRCPTVVNKDNWSIDIMDYYADENQFTYNPDVFSVEQRETDIVVTRTDSNSGWGMNLKFRCCGASTGTWILTEKDKECIDDTKPYEAYTEGLMESFVDCQKHCLIKGAARLTYWPHNKGCSCCRLLSDSYVSRGAQIFTRIGNFY